MSKGRVWQLLESAAKNAVDIVVHPGEETRMIGEPTEDLFYLASGHGRSKIVDNEHCGKTLRTTRATSEKIHNFAFSLALKRKEKEYKERVTCIDKANVFTSIAFCPLYPTPQI